jgi:hypothetical protein
VVEDIETYVCRFLFYGVATAYLAHAIFICRYRTMTVGGFQYTWAPDNQYINVRVLLHIWPFRPSPRNRWCTRTSGQLCSGPTPKFLRRIPRGEDTVVVELTTDAIQLGLQDTAIVVAVLLQCGHNIDRVLDACLTGAEVLISYLNRIIDVCGSTHLVTCTCHNLNLLLLCRISIMKG